MREAYEYTAYGLRVRSELELPYLAVARSAKPDVTVRYGAVPAALPEAARAFGLCQAAPGDFLFRMPGRVGIRVAGGREIVVQPHDGADESLITSLLIGTIWTGLLQQRGLLTLHASVIGTGKGAIAFLGPSGAGKSTLAAAMSARGHVVLADDIAAIRVNPGREPLVQPGYPFLRLWADALDGLKKSSLRLRRVRAHQEKYMLPAGRFSAEPQTLSAAYLLNLTNRGNAVFTAIRPSAALLWLRKNTHRRKLVDAFGHTREHFHATARIARDVPVVCLDRPTGAFRPDTLAERIESDLPGRCAH